MASKQVLSPDEIEKQRREKERKEKEDRERKEIEKRRKEKEEKKKRIEKRQNKKQKEEMKRIKKIIDFPFKTLFQVSSLITFLYFIVEFFGSEKLLYKAIYNSFVVFTSLYLGLGIVIVAIFLVISEKKEKEFEEELRLIMEERKAEDERKLREMKEIEDDIKSAARKPNNRTTMHNEENMEIENQIEAHIGFGSLPGAESEHFQDLGELDEPSAGFGESKGMDNLEFNDEDDYASILSDK